MKSTEDINFTRFSLMSHWHQRMSTVKKKQTISYKSWPPPSPPCSGQLSQTSPVPPEKDRNTLLSHQTLHMAGLSFLQWGNFWSSTSPGSFLSACCLSICILFKSEVEPHQSFLHLNRDCASAPPCLMNTLTCLCKLCPPLSWKPEW